MLQLGVNMIAETRNGYLFGVFVGRDGRGRLQLENAFGKVYSFDHGRCVTVNHGRSDSDAIALFVSRTYRWNHCGRFIRASHPYDRERSYRITLHGGTYACTCRGFEFSRNGTCKHIAAFQQHLGNTIPPPVDPFASVQFDTDTDE